MAGRASLQPQRLAATHAVQLRHRNQFIRHLRDQLHARADINAHRRLALARNHRPPPLHPLHQPQHPQHAVEVGQMVGRPSAAPRLLGWVDRCRRVGVEQRARRIYRGFAGVNGVL